MHSLIIGMTESGKTTLAKWFCRDLKKAGYKTAVLDPLLDEGWDCDFHTEDSDGFLAWAKNRENRTAFLFVDEGSISIGRYNVPMEWLATMSRHWGHSAFFISQGLTQLPPAVRNNCGKLYLFACADSVNKLAAEEFNEKALRGADRLPKLHFFVVSRFSELLRGRLDFAECTAYADKSTPQSVASG